VDDPPLRPHTATYVHYVRLGQPAATGLPFDPMVLLPLWSRAFHLEGHLGDTVSFGRLPSCAVPQTDSITLQGYLSLPHLVTCDHIHCGLDESSRPSSCSSRRESLKEVIIPWFRDVLRAAVLYHDTSRSL
jgi:hypothetical protein